MSHVIYLIWKLHSIMKTLHSFHINIIHFWSLDNFCRHIFSIPSRMAKFYDTISDNQEQPILILMSHTIIISSSFGNTHVCIYILVTWLERSYKTPGPRFKIKMTSYQYRKSHCGDKTILRPSYFHNGISYTGKMTSLYWIRALMNK